FTNKQDLFLTLFDELMRQIIGQFARPDPALPAAAQLETLLASSAQLITHDSPLRGLPLNFLMELWQEEVFWGRYQAAIEPFQSLVQTIIEAGIASGEFRPVAANALSWALIAQYDGLMLYALTGLSADVNAQVAALNELVLAGLGRRFN
ncbi:MAG TPA: hypothetical protein VHO69_13330, partial [Phototrophicaceae bacterium]|nr:hypothetical protein [Phototrophicaceae bacterium]